ncbi:heavy metal translocating P-type ATPase metal-binding domain-containing protein [Dyadobacter sp. CY312]|uniref:heavy metal translocating P-type ATPase n=1 Tax=Dyadobacter sp. CY312 TaxID=2907303 RepID=UPI001F3EAFB7|nr:heavy metal translocating P-type ATPase metal-binding domain-containing protein [Dyadobacter sp. CY312]MCE7040825.1 heavy metal translocating P-type ATPase metal-binding domain-containing protein [Dyadobacter sp. CY312]
MSANKLAVEEETPTHTTCYHCGEECRDEIIEQDGHEFCCDGCSVVYDLLKENDLCRYYNIDGAQGISPDKAYFQGKYDYLDLPEVSQKLLEFTDGRLSSVNWLVPKMHCSSCIWLLEQLYRLNPAIRSSVVNFPEKKVRITYDAGQIRLSELASLISSLGYEPYISLNDVEGKQIKKWNRTHLYKIGIAGFVFGNIMMLSFPEYFNLGDSSSDSDLRFLFNMLNIAFSLPFFFYCASDFFKSAWGALKGRYLNIDAPIALALTCIFLISLYQIFTETGPGYLDSLSGAVFFMLIGRYFQDKTYAGISFDRDYKSYFPVAVSVVDDGVETRKPITELTTGDQILVRNEELIPADSVLLSPRAMVDYSFVSGESEPVERKKGDTIYAGGKQKGPSIELEVLRRVSQSYLTQLWNHDTFSKEKEDQNQTLAARINKYFSVIVLIIATVTFLTWIIFLHNPETAFRAFTTSLLVACPCALLLSSTFTNGNLLALFGKNRFYPKNAHTIERLSHIDTVVFDKTGTITQANEAEVDFVGKELSTEELVMVKSISMQSSHPLSRMIVKKLADTTASKRSLGNYTETGGAGISAYWGKKEVRLGSSKWVGATVSTEEKSDASHVYFSVENEVYGYFTVKSKYRPELAETIKALQKNGYHTYLLSGDKPTDKALLTPVFGDGSSLLFEQKPEEKLRFIENLQQTEYRNVLMVGDGLNDAGALRQSNVGLAVSDDINNFSPSCDAIVEGNQLAKLPAYMKLAKSGQQIIKLSFGISLFYNIAGLAFAVTGNLSPVIAAILMPVSSITIVAFTTLASNLAARKWIKN